MTTRSDRRPRRLGTLIAIAASALLIALLAYGVARQSPDATIDDSLAAGEAIAAPAFSLEIIAPGGPFGPLRDPLAAATRDDRLSLGELRGTPFVLNFWASWCEPCIEEAPLLERTWRRRARPAGVAFVGLAMLDTANDSRDFMREYGITYPNIRDGEGRVPRRYSVPALPETFFITADGRIVGHVIGVIGESQLRDGIAAARSGRILGARAGGDRRPAR